MINYNFSVQDLEYFLLIFTRVTLFIYSAPFFSIGNVPRRFKAGLGIFLAMLLYQFVVPHSVVEYDTVLSYAIIVFKEATCGVLMGLMCNIIVLVTNFAGKVMDMETGLSMMQFFDPGSRQQTGFTGTIFNYSFLLIMMCTNLHHYLIRAFIESYQLIPVGHVIIREDKLYMAVLTILYNYMQLGLKICLPIFCAMLLLNAILGIMAKAAPQMHMFSIGMQLKILTGLGVLLLTMYLMPGVADAIFVEMKKMMVTAVGVFY